VVTTGELEASVLEVRLIHDLVPRFNRQSKHWRKYAYLKLTLDERFPRLSVVRQAKPGDGCLYVGPLGSTAAARLVAEAIETAVPIRRCTKRVSTKLLRSAPCAPAQLGVSTCPCSGDISQAGYQAVVDHVVVGLTESPELLLGPLEQRMRALAGMARFEEAADMRDRAAALARAVAKQRRIDALRRAGRLTVEVPGEGGAVLEGGRLVATWGQDGGQVTLVGPGPDAGGSWVDGPLPRHLADEVSAVAAWLDARAARVRVLACEGEWSSLLPRLPRYEPRGAAARLRASA
jgi:DNA polymerase-3 subunit epsilon